MKQQKRKGFTLVELLVVIAILAVLATVSIVGYTSFIKKANVSNDTALAKQINDILIAEEVVSGKPEDFYAVVAILQDNGFVIANLNPTNQGNWYAWDADSNQILYLDQNLNVIYSSRDYTSTKDEWYYAVSSSADVTALKALDVNPDRICLLASSSKDLQEALLDGESFVLTNDITLSEPLSYDNAEKDITIALNGNTLSYTNSKYSWFSVTKGANLTIKGGTLEANGINNITTGVICASEGSSVTLEDVTFETSASALYPKGNATTINVINSTIIAECYAIATNAATLDNYNVVINVENSTLTSKAEAAVLFNIPGKLNITNTTINGAYQGVVVRGGTAILTNCTIINKVTKTGDFTNKYDDGWQSGNEVTVGALVFGNHHSTSYQYATSVTLKNTTVIADNSACNYNYPAIYGYGNSGESLGATLTYDSDCVINGDIISGNEYATINGKSNFNSASSGD